MKDQIILEYSLEAIDSIDLARDKIEALVGMDKMMHQLLLLAKIRFWTMNRLVKLNVDWAKSKPDETQKAYESLANYLDLLASSNLYESKPDFLIEKVKV